MPPRSAAGNTNSNNDNSLRRGGGEGFHLVRRVKNTKRYTISEAADAYRLNPSEATFQGKIAILAPEKEYGLVESKNLKNDPKHGHMVIFTRRLGQYSDSLVKGDDVWFYVVPNPFKSGKYQAEFVVFNSDGDNILQWNPAYGSTLATTAVSQNPTHNYEEWKKSQEKRKKIEAKLSQNIPISNMDLTGISGTALNRPSTPLKPATESSSRILKSATENRDKNGENTILNCEESDATTSKEKSVQQDQDKSVQQDQDKSVQQKRITQPKPPFLTPILSVWADPPTIPTDNLANNTTSNSDVSKEKDLVDLIENPNSRSSKEKPKEKPKEKSKPPCNTTATSTGITTLAGKNKDGTQIGFTSKKKDSSTEMKTDSKSEHSEEGLVSTVDGSDADHPNSSSCDRYPNSSCDRYPNSCENPTKGCEHSSSKQLSGSSNIPTDIEVKDPREYSINTQITMGTDYNEYTGSTLNRTTTSEDTGPTRHSPYHDVFRPPNGISGPPISGPPNGISGPPMSGPPNGISGPPISVPPNGISGPPISGPPTCMLSMPPPPGRPPPPPGPPPMGVEKQYSGNLSNDSENMINGVNIGGSIINAANNGLKGAGLNNIATVNSSNEQNSFSNYHSSYSSNHHHGNNHSSYVSNEGYKNSYGNNKHEDCSNRSWNGSTYHQFSPTARPFIPGQPCSGIENSLVSMNGSINSNQIGMNDNSNQILGYNNSDGYEQSIWVQSNRDSGYGIPMWNAIPPGNGIPSDNGMHPMGTITRVNAWSKNGEITGKNDEINGKIHGLNFSLTAEEIQSFADKEGIPLRKSGIKDSEKLVQFFYSKLNTCLNPEQSNNRINNRISVVSTVSATTTCPPTGTSCPPTGTSSTSENTSNSEPPGLVS